MGYERWDTSTCLLRLSPTPCLKVSSVAAADLDTFDPAFPLDHGNPGTLKYAPSI